METANKPEALDDTAEMEEETEMLDEEDRRDEEGLNVYTRQDDFLPQAAAGISQAQQQRRFTARGDQESRMATNPFDDLCVPAGPASAKVIALYLTRRPGEKEAIVTSYKDRKPLYTAKYSGPRDTIVTILYHDPEESESSRQMYKITKPENGRVGPVEVEAAWIDESNSSFTFISKNRQETWSSAVGTLEGHRLLWMDLGGEVSDETCIRCFDVDGGFRDVCTVLGRGRGRSTIRIPAELLANQEALDEMIGVTFAAWEQRKSWPSHRGLGGLDPGFMVNNLHRGDLARGGGPPERQMEGQMAAQVEPKLGMADEGDEELPEEGEEMGDEETPAAGAAMGQQMGIGANLATGAQP
jgi:hypothetical protein